MSDTWMGVLDLGLVFGLVLIWALREIWVLKRDDRARRAALEIEATQESREPARD